MFQECPKSKLQADIQIPKDTPKIARRVSSKGSVVEPIQKSELIGSLAQTAITTATPAAAARPPPHSNTPSQTTSDDDLVITQLPSTPEMVYCFKDKGIDIAARNVWKQWFPNADEPILTTRGLPPAGHFEVPFPLERDWKACFLDRGQKLAEFTSYGVELGYKEHGNGQKVVLFLNRHAPYTTPINQLGLLNAWADLCVWHKELLQGKDVSILYIFKREFEKRIAAAGKTMADIGVSL